MSSHREAPEISKDPVADSTDLYAFVSAGNTVTLIANYIPLQLPAGGPNFYEFGDDVLYEIHIDNNGDGRADISYGVPVPDHGAQPQHLPVQHGTDQLADRPELEPVPDLRRHRDLQRGARVRGPASRRLLRGSGRDLRPGRPAAVREPAFAAEFPQGRSRRQRHRQPERALDRAA